MKGLLRHNYKKIPTILFLWLLLWRSLSTHYSDAQRINVITTSAHKNGMMTSPNGNIFHVTGLLWGEFTGHRWIPLTKASDAELWVLLSPAPWINGWVNNREAGNFRRHRAHYDVIVMVYALLAICEETINPSGFSWQRVSIGKPWYVLCC